MNSKKIKVLVVGGSGFLGSYVADELEKENYDVTIFDQHKSDWITPNQKFIQGHILDQKHLEESVRGMDVVYHFAAIADIGAAKEGRSQSIEVNIMGSSYLLEACLKHKVKTFVFASTVYVYSNHGSFYRIAKQCVENLIEEYAKYNVFDYRILRYGSLYGPRSQNWNGLRKYLSQMLTENKITLRSKGETKREYIHALDAARLSVEALNSKFKNQHLVITGSQSITGNELVTMISEVIEKKINITYTDDNVDGHYIITPYKFIPKYGFKLTSNTYVDFGQGLLELLEELHHEKK